MKSEFGNLADFVSTVTLITTKVGLDLSVDRRQHFIEGPGRDALESELRSYLMGSAATTQPVVPAILPYPKDGEVFELTIGSETKKFILVSVDYQSSWDNLQAALQRCGVIPEAPEKCRDAFKAKYSMADGKGPIGVAKASWVGPNGSASFPCVRSDGGARFRWIDDVFSAGWRWLVEVQA